MALLVNGLLVICVLKSGFVLSKPPLLCAFKYNKEVVDNVHFTIKGSALQDVKIFSPVADNRMPKETYNHLLQTTDHRNSLEYEHCSNLTNFCYTFWQVKHLEHGLTRIVMGQGCLAPGDDVTECQQKKCIHKQPIRSLRHSRYCCCSSTFCNLNFTEDAITIDDDEYINDVETTLLLYLAENIVFVSASFCAFTVIVMCICFYCVVCSDQKEFNGELKHVRVGRRAKTAYCVKNLKLLNIIGKGKYGTVWRGIINDGDVAVKIFPTPYKSVFLNEKGIYQLPCMNESTILTYLDCAQQCTKSGDVEYYLFLSYHPLGCLQTHLQNFQLDWMTFCKMALSVARGLAYLHLSVKNNDQEKPSICHRDLNTRNILVKSDLSCCISDFGLSMTLKPESEVSGDRSEYITAETGTLQYMAPEVLEGAVNLIDKETTLKQIDMYAYGFVLWELVTRCRDLYPVEIGAPNYRKPFEIELGPHPTFEQIRTHVLRQRKRPMWPFEKITDIWIKSDVHRLIRDTVEDCWDDDAEARLTALCVEQRLQCLTFMKKC